jgi:hypothetical protein
MTLYMIHVLRETEAARRELEQAAYAELVAWLRAAPSTVAIKASS